MKLLSASIVFLTLLIPTIGAHTPPGPKNFCEWSSDVSTHDYVGAWTQGYQVVSANGNTNGDCNADTVPGDSDGHMDWATGGATLLADTGNGITYGSLACLGEWADHVPQTEIVLIDAVAGGAVAFEVSGDWSRVAATRAMVEDKLNAATPHASAPILPGIERPSPEGIVDYIPPEPTYLDCGDGIVEPCDPTDPTAVDQVTCNARDGQLICYAQPIGSASNSCTPTFGPGANGDYLVRVLYDTNPAHPSSPVAGHIIN